MGSSLTVTNTFQISAGPFHRRALVLHKPGYPGDLPPHPPRAHGLGKAASVEWMASFLSLS